MKKHYKLWIILSMIFLFATGVVCGILLDTHILAQKLPTPPKKEPPPHFPTLETFAQKLNLSEEQKEEIKEIFQRNEERLKEFKKQIHHKFASMRSQLQDEIKEVLTDEQWAQMEAMIQKFREKRKKEFLQKKQKSESRKGERK
ncbi:hypothetical protein KGY73_08485 [bacterium]|nr:hypothetical protein [bacterium]